MDSGTANGLDCDIRTGIYIYTAVQTMDWIFLLFPESIVGKVYSPHNMV